MREGRLPRPDPLLQLGRRGGERALALGMYISISGIVTFKAAESLRADRARHPARPAAGRDRRALPRARAEARQDQRARLRRPYRRQGGRAQGLPAGRARGRDHRQFFRLFAKAERAGAGDDPGLRHVGGRAADRLRLRAWPLDPTTRAIAAGAARILVEDQGKSMLVDTSPDLRRSSWTPGSARSTR